jgi:3-hydroxybutyryl-CoA dehydratase
MTDTLSRPTELFSRAFDDLAPGQRFTTRGRTVTESDVVAFAGLTGDFHPQHVDAEWSASSAFGERIAHGLLVLSMAAGLVPFDPARVVALRRVRDVVFKRPVHFGDTITVQGEVKSLSELDESTGLVAVGLTVCGAGGRTVARATVEVLWARNGVAAASATTAADALTCVPL